MNPTHWIATLTDDTVKQVAKKANIPERTLHHQIGRGTLSIENILKIAVTYNHHPTRALIEWGHIDASWERIPDIEAALRAASEEPTLDELEGIAAACLGCMRTDIVITEE